MDGNAIAEGTDTVTWSFLPAPRFAEIAAQWEALRTLGPATPMLAADFIAVLLQEFGTGKELIALCHTGEALQAAAVLAPCGRANWATFQPAQMPVGPWIQGPGLSLPTLLAGLTRALPGCALLVGLTQCDPFLLARPVDDGRTRTSDYIDTARISIDGDVESWWNSRGKNLRANLKKQRNRLAAAGTDTHLEVIRASAEIEAAITQYGYLERTGWKGNAGTAVAADNQQGQFYRRMLEAFCTRGQGSIYRYYFGEQLVAMDLCIEDGDCIVVLKTAYDESVPKHYSPALLMREEICRQLFIEKRFQRIEFYGKVMEWHTRWTDEVRSLYHVNHYRWSTIGRLHDMRRLRVGSF